MYNTSRNDNQDDIDLTMINHSFLYDPNDAPISTHVPILKHLQQANQSSKIVYDQNERTNQLEQILNYYRQELKQKTNTQFDCDRNLITRLIDFIRSIYSSNKKKLKDLDILFNDISDLHDKRFNEQKEKNEQFQEEISYLKKLIITSDNEDNTNRKISRINSIVDYEEWMEIEEETRKLHNLVKNQQNQINELFKLLPYQENFPHQDSSFKTIIDPSKEPPFNTQQSAAFNANVDNTLVSRLRALADRQQYSALLDATVNCIFDADLILRRISSFKIPTKHAFGVGVTLSLSFVRWSLVWYFGAEP
ncbi:unnamed protein product [Rotaria sordida]|uniref:Uncharacterized protein n=1 Tax=Rotaria sordida TaxID=392033 RepID=A0A819EZ32_9BILA|nr:unnamed protein product [Rotaria sordida]